MASIYDILDNIFNGVDPKEPVGEYRTNTSPGSGLMDAINWAASKRDGVIDSMNRNTYGSVSPEEWDSMMRKEEEPFIGPSQANRPPLDGVSDAFREIFNIIDKNSYSGRKKKRESEATQKQSPTISAPPERDRPLETSDPLKVIRKLQEGIDGKANTFIAKGDDIFSSYDKRDIVDSKNKAGQTGFSRVNKPIIPDSDSFTGNSLTTEYKVPPKLARELEKSLTNPKSSGERQSAIETIYGLAERKRMEEEQSNLLQSPFGPEIAAIQELKNSKDKDLREKGVSLEYLARSIEDPEMLRSILRRELGMDAYVENARKSIK